MEDNEQGKKRYRNIFVGVHMKTYAQRGDSNNLFVDCTINEFKEYKGKIYFFN